MYKIEKKDEGKYKAMGETMLNGFDDLSEEDQKRLEDHYGSKLCFVDILGIVYGTGLGLPVDFLLTEVTDDNVKELMTEFGNTVLSCLNKNDLLDEELKIEIEGNLINE